MNLSSLTKLSFANPGVLLILALVPVLIFAYLWRGHQSSLSITLSSYKTKLSNLVDKLGFHLPFIIRMFTIILIIFLLARPQLGQSFTRTKHNGLDIMLAVDTSQSMSALDLELSGQSADRLTVVKSILKDFVLKRNNDRLGFIVFGEKAFTQCPLTMDHGAILDLIEHLQIGMVGNATAIGDAIAVAAKRLKDLKAKSRVLILMTDGQNTAGSISPQLATDMAKELGIKIYTIGIGQDDEVPFKVDTPIGPVMVKASVPIDEESMINIAEATGGQYFRARSTQDLVKIYNHINKLEKTEIENKEYNSFKDAYEPLLWAAFIGLALEIFLANTILFRII